MSKKVLVLMGWLSAEREVSLITGRGAAEALRRTGYQVTEHDLTDTAVLVEELKRQQPDVVFNALHGNWGEDGEIQGPLDFNASSLHSIPASRLRRWNGQKDLTKMDLPVLRH